MKNIDLNEECKLLLGEIEKNCRKTKMMREAIERLKARRNEIVKDQPSVTFEDDYDDDDIEEENGFEDEVEFYLEDYRNLDDDFSLEDLIDVLPVKSNYSFEKILLRLQAESLKEIKELQEILMDSSEISKEELIEYRKLIETEKRKMLFLRKILSDKEEILPEQIEPNKIILVPNLYGNIRVLEELENIPIEYYPFFRELVDSIRDGSFKGVKRFTNNRLLNGISEVRGFKVRIAFTRVGKKTYALITAFVKKVNTDHLYQKTLASKIDDYRIVYKNIKDNLDDPVFLEENAENVDRLFELLGMEEEKRGAK